MKEEITDLARPSDISVIPVFEQVRAKLDALNQIKDAIAQDGDGYDAGDKRVPDKNYLRRYGMCVELTYEILHREIFREENFKIASAYYEVRVTLPSGRYAVGVGSASKYQERAWNKNDDIPMTAHSRAVSRAIDDLLGVGSLGKTAGTSETQIGDEDVSGDFI